MQYAHFERYDNNPIHLIFRLIRGVYRATTLLWALVCMGLAGAALPVPVQARPAWQDEIHRFHEHDVGVWRRGYWRHGWHAGRCGWWWVVGGAWYWYPVPVYPYPDPYTPPVVVQAPPTAPPQAQAQLWYYCERPAGYYPYVPECPSGWKTVPATPPVSPAPAPPSPAR
jgi:hypothetical protein